MREGSTKQKQQPRQDYQGVVLGSAHEHLNESADVKAFSLHHGRLSKEATLAEASANIFGSVFIEKRNSVDNVNKKTSNSTMISPERPQMQNTNDFQTERRGGSRRLFSNMNRHTQDNRIDEEPTI